MHQAVDLCLSGYGYLKNIRETKQGTVFTISILSGTVDDVELGCVTSSATMSSLIKDLIKECKVGQWVMLQFQASFLRLGYCHHDIAEDEPSHMLGLQGKLVKVHAWHEDETQKNSLYLAATTNQTKMGV